MTGPRLDSFQKALDRFKKALPPNLVDEFSVCTLRDVRDICRDIQDMHGREGKLRHMRRLAAFVEAMEQFGKVVEVFANVNEIVCFIWGPIKFLLGITKTHMDSFDKLLDVYDKIGNAIPGLLRYQAAFEKHSPLATVLEDYYSDILRFHQAALSVFRRPRWKELFHSTWKTFDSKFGPILQSMEKRRELLESEKGSATLYEVQKLRQDISDMYARQRNRTVQEDAEKHRREVCYVREKLEAPNYKLDQEMSTEDRHGYSSGTWIFEDPSFCSWSNYDTPGHGVLYVNGIPGAGKTTLMSAVTERFLDNKCSEGKNHCVAYFYFKQKQPNKVSHNSSLRAILLQLVERDSAISDHLFEKVSSTEGVNLRSTKVLEGLVKTALESYRISYIVLDGLDECAPNEAAKSVGWFLSLINGGLAGTNAALRVLFCGQRDGTLDKLLSDQPYISLEASRHVEDIRQYCRDFGGKIREKFKIPLEMEEEIILKVTNAAQGMFLYARVVLENLLNQTRLSRLKEEIEPGTFPQGIEKAYERVAVRIFEMSSTAEREDAKKILGWIICSRRLLRWREIQSLFCIDPIKGDIDYEERRLRVTCKELCGSLVDVHYATNKNSPEDIIKIVHETAREYLVRRKWLDASFEHARLATFCSRYLTSAPFAFGINEEDIVTHAVKGFYALQDYAVQYWFDHFRECTRVSVTLDPDQFLEVMASARVFLESYRLPSKTKSGHDAISHDEVARTIAEFPGNSYERNECLNIEHRTILIRKTIETLHRRALDPTAHEILTNLHGNITPYKCTKPWCESFTVGFENTEDRKQHTNRHDRPFRCPLESCFAFQLGYDTRAKLDQHKKSHHPEPDNEETRFPNISRKKVTIWTAAKQGDLATVGALLDSGVDVNQLSGYNLGKTPLYLAAKYGHFEICKMLLKRGANIILAGHQRKRTALHAAVAAGNLDIVHLLVSQEECQPDRTDALGRSPFCEACALGHLDIVKLLLETGKIRTDLQPRGHPECRDVHFYPSTVTPLGYACGQGHFAVVQYLLQQGQSNLLSVDALNIATRCGHDDILNLVRPMRPMLIGVGNGLSQGNLPSNFVIDQATTSLKTGRDDWSVVYNLDTPLVLNVDLAYTLQYERRVACVRFSLDGEYLATGYSVLLHIHIVATGKWVCTLHDKSVDRTVSSIMSSVCFSPDGKYVATGNESGLIQVWDITTRTIRNTFRGHQGRINSVEFGGDNRTIASGGADSTMQFWDIETETCFMTQNLNDGVASVAISPDMRFLVAGCRDGSLWVWDSFTGALAQPLLSNGTRRNGIHGIAFLPNGRELVALGTSPGESMMKLWAWDLQAESISSTTMLEGHAGSIFSATLTSDAQWVLAGSQNGKVQFWDSRTGQTQLTVCGHKSWVNSVAASPTGDYFATASQDEKVRIWSYIQLGPMEMPLETPPDVAADFDSELDLSPSCAWVNEDAEHLETLESNHEHSNAAGL
ncbi:WD40 repeat-like protein [Xylaria acuta]|nr:WD40 repeat-like protein [Xylaria acuta]